MYMQEGHRYDRVYRKRKKTKDATDNLLNEWISQLEEDDNVQPKERKGEKES